MIIIKHKGLNFYKFCNAVLRKAAVFLVF